MAKQRCSWADNQEIYINYHDEEWGVPVHDDRVQFEFLILEGVQAGLSWLTVLRKRENYRKAYAKFDPALVAEFGEKEFEKFMQDTGLIRNRLKIKASFTNAKHFLEVQKEFGSFSKYLWKFVGDMPVTNKWNKLSQIPAKTKLSDEISKDLKNRGFKFVGSTIIYAHLQATGLVNDHLVDCFRYQEITKLKWS